MHKLYQVIRLRYVDMFIIVYVHIRTLDDDSRVKVKGGVTDYINASYIDVNSSYMHANKIKLFQLFVVWCRFYDVSHYINICEYNKLMQLYQYKYNINIT